MTRHTLYSALAATLLTSSCLASDESPVVTPPVPLVMDEELIEMPNPAVIAPNTYYHQGNPAAMDESLTTGPSPAVIEPYAATPDDGAVNNDDPVVERNPFQP